MTWETVAQLVLLQLITFLALVLVLRKIMYASSLEETRRLQALSQENSRKAQELSRKIDEAEDLYQKRLNKGQEEARQLRRQAQEEMRTERDAMLEKAREESRHIVAEGFNTIEKIRDEIRGEMRPEAVRLALRCLERILLEPHRRALHDCFFEDLLRELGRSENARFLESGETVTVESAFPLTEAEQERLGAALGNGGTGEEGLAFRVEPACAAGVRLRAGGMVLDASLSGALEEQARILEEG